MFARRGALLRPLPHLLHNLPPLLMVSLLLGMLKCLLLEGAVVLGGTLGVAHVVVPEHVAQLVTRRRKYPLRWTSLHPLTASLLYNCRPRSTLTFHLCWMSHVLQLVTRRRKYPLTASLLYNCRPCSTLTPHLITWAPRTQGRRLYQEWLCDSWVVTESQRLRYLRWNQQLLRASVYQGVTDAIAQGDVEGARQGRLIVLPGDDVDALINHVYGELGNIHDPEQRQQYLIDRAILTPLNDDVDSLNERILAMFPTPARAPANGGAVVQRRVYLSADDVDANEQVGIFPPEFLNSLSFSGVPPHRLILQVGCPIILLRNLADGLANGTRMVVEHLGDRFLQAKVASGPRAGQSVFLPRLTLTPSDVERLPFTLRRRQFPIRLAYAMTINKSQGQTLGHVGVYLPKPVFTHGQLYVAASRVGRRECLKFLVPQGLRAADAEAGSPAGVYTSNVVYKEALLPDRPAQVL
jgi:hypothetical protein